MVIWRCDAPASHSLFIPNVGFHVQNSKKLSFNTKLVLAFIATLAIGCPTFVAATSKPKEPSPATRAAETQKESSAE